MANALSKYVVTWYYAYERVRLLLKTMEVKMEQAVFLGHANCHSSGKDAHNI